MPEQPFENDSGDENSPVHNDDDEIEDDQEEVFVIED
jgi:hypothetical protein